MSTLLSLASCSSCRQLQSVNDTPVSSLDLHRYLGTWYEIARIDHFFEKDMDFTQAYYVLKNDGTVVVENSGIKKGKMKRSKGVAKLPDPVNNPAWLRVSFFRPFYSDYRVLMVDPEYRYALVSSKGPDYLWILSREPSIPEEILRDILSEAKVRGFNTTRLTWVNQDRESYYSSLE